MASMLVKLVSAVQLTRLTMAFGAVADVWFIILLTRGMPEYETIRVSTMSLFAALAAGAVIAVGLFAYGASLNDPTAVFLVGESAALCSPRSCPAPPDASGREIRWVDN